MPNSVYYTLPHLIGEPDSAPWQFTRAIQRAMNWMNDHDGEDCTDLLTQYWPSSPSRSSSTASTTSRSQASDRRPHRP